jgi:diguanylate cyclase (GGDEF)-like protein/PAS domain S-box-containing protein
VNKEKILIVDDEPINISLIAKVLGEEYELLVTTDPKEGLDLAKKHLPSLLLLDIIMPEIDGYELAKELKEDLLTSEIPIIFLTAKSDAQSIVKGFKVGAVDYISKPFVKEELLARVKTHLQIHSLNASLHQSVKKLQHNAEIMDEYVISSSTDLNGKIIATSKAYEIISKYTKEELIGKSHNITRFSETPKEIYKELWGKITNGEIWKGEINSRAKDGTSYWSDITIVPDFDEDGNKLGYTAIRQNITSKKRIEEIAIHDELTQLHNRRYFNQVFEHECNRVKRSNSNFLFMMLDVDHFKNYNDTYGHQDGDRVLQEIGKILNNHTKRAGDYAFRLGGEEFGILAQNRSKDEAISFAQKIIKAVELLKIEHIANENIGYLTISIGLFFRELNIEDTPNDIYKECDDLLYKAKHSGRNRVES